VYTVQTVRDRIQGNRSGSAFLLVILILLPLGMILHHDWESLAWWAVAMGAVVALLVFFWRPSQVARREARKRLREERLSQRQAEHKRRVDVEVERLREKRRSDGL
jgi:hypothetical protein